MDRALRTPRPLTALAVAFVASIGLVACSDDGGGSFIRGDDVQITVNPNPVTFGTVVVGAQDQRVVTVRHNGTSGELQLRRVWLESQSDELSITEPLNSRLRPGESTTFVVHYAPLDAIQDRGTIYIETNVAAQGGALTVSVPVETLAQLAQLQAFPDPVNFGDVETGTSEARIVSFVNVGAQAIRVEGIRISAGPDGDFSLLSPAPLDTYPPESSFSVEVGYTPTNGDTDTGHIEVDYYAGEETQLRSKQVLITGREVGPFLVAFPNPIDFGWRALDVTAEQPLMISNQGARDLHIDDVRLSTGSSDTVTVTGFPAGGTVLAAGSGAVLSLTVQFTPRSDMVQTTGPIAAVLIESNDGQNDGVFDINVFGRAESPVLQVNPPDTVDFGFVAQNLATQRTVALYNAGSAPLSVASISLSDNPSGEFRVVADPSWGPLAASPSPGVLAPGQYKEVRVTFTNEGAPTGTQWGKLRIESNDGQRPIWEVDLRAQRTDSPTCEVTLVPSQRDFGTVPRGHQKKMTMNLVNVGSGDCSFHSAFVNDCFGLFFGGICDDPANTTQLSGTSQYYRVTGTPPAIQNGLKAGESYPIEITFTAPDDAPIFGDDLMTYAALLAVRIIDPYSGSTAPVVYPGPVSGGLSTHAPNLHAKSGVPNLAVLPQEVDFGTTTIGCHSQTITVTAYNIGSAELQLTDVRLQGCTPEFRVKSGPGIPMTLQPNGSASWDLVYVPQDLGSDSCGMEFFTDSDTPVVVVPLRGAGTYESSHVDEFVQTAGSMVDILFVVDNSGSMSDLQANLSNNMQTFLSAAVGWNADIHLGVTSTDMDKDAGKLLGNPRYVTSANPQPFIQNVMLGTNGSPHEQGLAAAQAALSLPLAADSTVACTGDSECNAPERCYDGFCGGPNRGFLRGDAGLEIVFVGDEDDQSPAGVDFYVDFFKSIKGYHNENLFHAHAITGPPGGCQTSHGSAVPGPRFIHVANATGGLVESICEPSFAQVLAGIGDLAFGLRVQFFLTRLADPGTVQVTVDGAPCPSQGGNNWTYQASSNSVIFKENGACMPAEGQLVRIAYDTLCLLE